MNISFFMMSHHNLHEAPHLRKHAVCEIPFCITYVIAVL